MLNIIKGLCPGSKYQQNKNREIHEQIKKALENSDIRLCCIIPAYNEESRINRVLADISNYEFFDTILVVNDGSSDNTVKEVRKFKILKEQENLKILDLKKNLGKAGAVLRGVDEVEEDLIVFLDADLVGLIHSNIDKLIYPLICKDYSMTILDRPTDRRAVSALFGLARLFGGERAVWKKDFLEMDLSYKDGYTLETKMNLHYLESGKKVRTVYAPNLETILHTKKDSMVKGITLYLKMFWSMYKETGVRKFYIQASDVEYDKLEELYKFYNKRKHKKLYRPGIFGVIYIISVILFVFLNVIHFLRKKKDN